MDRCCARYWFDYFDQHRMMETYSYKTVQSISEAIFTDKGSKFIGYLFPIENTDDFKQQLKGFRSDHAGARHFCYAFRLGKQNTTDRSSDDGEPSGTAGKPILNQMISAGISQCGLIVVRYFGGTLLGTSGLINAYKSAAKLAIEKGYIIEKPITSLVTIQVSYEKYNELMLLLKKNNIHYQQLESSDDSIRFSIEIPLNIEAHFKSELNSLIL
jgi:uncharacterized YigZ family protein